MFIYFLNSLFYESDDYYCKPSELMTKEGGAIAMLTRTKVNFFYSSF